MCMFGNLKQEVACEKQVNVFLRKRKTFRFSGGLSCLESYTTERLPKTLPTILLVVSLRNILSKTLPSQTTENTTGNITTEHTTKNTTEKTTCVLIFNE